MTQHLPHGAVIRTKTPRARCRECGSHNVFAACCRCRRLMCKEHDTVTRPISLRGLWGRGEQVHGADADDDAAARLPERHYCPDCRPLVRRYDGETAAASITLALGLLTAAWHLVIGSVLAVAGGLRVGRSLVVAYRRRRALRDAPPELCLDPQIRKLSMVETMSGTAQLNGGHGYRADVTAVHGKIEMDALWDHARWRRVVAYRQRHRIPEDWELPFCAGLLAVTGPAGLELHPADEEGLDGVTLALRSTVARHPVLRPPDGRRDPRWRLDIDYAITEPEDGWVLPVRLSPTIIPKSGRRALDIEVQWHAGDLGGGRLRMKDLELVRIEVPSDWGEVEDISDPEHAVVGVPPQDDPGPYHRRPIQWKKPAMAMDSRSGSHRLAVLFQQPIRPTDRVTGRLRARFTGAISGAEGVTLYGAGGVEHVSATPDTVVDIAFDLSLAAVRYQDMRSVPDQSRPEERASLEPKPYRDVAPDHHTVALLTNSLSDGGYYIKRVVENPPQPGVRTGVLNRFWDIAGRRYDGVFPIDFHLVLTGEEVHDGMSASGTTFVRLTVRGAYATSVMEEKIVREWAELRDRIDACMESAGSRRP